MDIKKIQQNNEKKLLLLQIYLTVLESDWPNPVMASAEIKYVPEQEYVSLSYLFSMLFSLYFILPSQINSRQKIVRESGEVMMMPLLLLCIMSVVPLSLTLFFTVYSFPVVEHTRFNWNAQVSCSKNNSLSFFLSFSLSFFHFLVILVMG